MHNSHKTIVLSYNAKSNMQCLTNSQGIRPATSAIQNTVNQEISKGSQNSQNKHYKDHALKLTHFTPRRIPQAFTQS